VWAHNPNGQPRRVKARQLVCQRMGFRLTVLVFMAVLGLAGTCTQSLHQSVTSVPTTKMNFDANKLSSLAAATLSHASDERHTTHLSASLLDPNPNPKSVVTCGIQTVRFTLLTSRLLRMEVRTLCLG
jgi:hypothetical protein